MWADNETSVDLLGFDYLVDSLELVLTEPRLLPLTVGVLGDWGSGKSSLLRMVGERLRLSAEGALSPYIVVPFSPWRYEAYEDVKTALMDSVLTALSERISPGDEIRKDLLHRLRKKVARMMAGPAAAARTLAPTVGSFVAAHQQMSPEMGAAAGSAIVAGIDAVVSRSDSASMDEPTIPLVFESVSDFREEFERLVAGLDGVRAVIVLIDDLDRCLDGTVVDVLEAIRLFLQVSSTAFVIAANREIVQAAIERRYPTLREGGTSIGRDYLEKVIQIEITVPPLAQAEAETYLNLLFADLHLTSDEMDKIRKATVGLRRENQFVVAMNYGIAKDLLENVSDELQSDFTIANHIAPALSRGLRGNPRQLKRFLNTMLLRIATAKRRGVNLDHAILAKLMILELSPKDFQQLFLWQLDQHGVPEELVVAESGAATDKLGEDESPELKTWFASQAVKNWLKLEPSLTGTSLSEYFFFSRDHLSPAAPGARLSGKMQVLLGRLQLTTSAQRRTAVDEAAALETAAYAPLYEALLERAVRRPEGDAMRSAMEITEKVPGSWPALVAALKTIPPQDIPISLPARLATFAGNSAELKLLLEIWEASGIARLVSAVAAVKKAKH